jgi:hypothetical protein
MLNTVGRAMFFVSIAALGGKPREDHMDYRMLTFSTAIAGAVLAVGGLTASSVSAAPAGFPASASQAGDTVKVRYDERRHPRRHVRRHHRRHYGYEDNVGSIVHDGYGYGFNRFSGQRYYSCQFDEGYGRVKPCDSGGAPN